MPTPPGYPSALDGAGNPIGPSYVYEHGFQPGGYLSANNAAYLPPYGMLPDFGGAGRLIGGYGMSDLENNMLPEAAASSYKPDPAK